MQYRKCLRDSVCHPKKADEFSFSLISLSPSVGKQFPIFFKWCVRLPSGSSVYHIGEIVKQIHFMHPASECYRVEYGAPFGPLMAAEEQKDIFGNERQALHLRAYNFE